MFALHVDVQFHLVHLFMLTFGSQHSVLLSLSISTFVRKFRFQLPVDVVNFRFQFPLHFRFQVSVPRILELGIFKFRLYLFDKNIKMFLGAGMLQTKFCCCSCADSSATVRPLEHQTAILAELYAVFWPFRPEFPTLPASVVSLIYLIMLRIFRTSCRYIICIISARTYSKIHENKFISGFQNVDFLHQIS